MHATHHNNINGQGLFCEVSMMITELQCSTQPHGGSICICKIAINARLKPFNLTRPKALRSEYYY